MLIFANFCFAAFAIAQISSLEGLTLDEVFNEALTAASWNCSITTNTTTITSVADVLSYVSTQTYVHWLRQYYIHVVVCVFEEIFQL